MHDLTDNTKLWNNYFKFSRFDVYWIQTDKQTNKQTDKPNLYIDERRALLYIYCYIFLYFKLAHENIQILDWIKAFNIWKVWDAKGEHNIQNNLLNQLKWN